MKKSENARLVAKATNNSLLSPEATHKEYKKINYFTPDKKAVDSTNQTLRAFDKLTDEAKRLVMSHSISNNYFCQAENLLLKYPLELRLCYENVGNKPALLDWACLDVDGLPTSIINIYVDEISKPKALTLRITKLIAQWLDCAINSELNGEIVKSPFKKDFLSYSKGREIFERMQGIALEKHPKKGCLVRFDESQRTEWWESIYKTNYTLSVRESEKPKKTGSLHALQWECVCEECKKELPPLKAAKDPEAFKDLKLIKKCTHTGKDLIIEIGSAPLKKRD